MAYPRSTSYDTFGSRRPYTAATMTEEPRRYLHREAARSPPRRPTTMHDEGRRYYHRDEKFNYDTAVHRQPQYGRPNTGGVTTFMETRDEPSLKLELMDLETKLKQRDLKVVDLEKELESYQEIENQQAKTVRQMHEKVEELQRELGERDSTRSIAESKLASVESENRQLHERLASMDDRLRHYAESQDVSAQHAQENQRNYEELRRTVSSLLTAEGFHETRTHDVLLKKLRDFMDYHNDLKLKTGKLEHGVAIAEEEARKNQETVKKLLDDIERTRKYIAETENLKEERDASVRQQDRLQQELRQLEQRLVGQQEECERAQHELRQHQGRLADMDVARRQNELTTQATTNDFRAFKELLSTLLSDGGSLSVSPSEEALKEAVRRLMHSRQDNQRIGAQLEQRLTDLSAQLEEQARLHKDAVQRARKAELENETIRLRMKETEGELTATDIMKETLQKDQHKYQKFLEQMADTMKMESVVKDLGLELNGDALLARVEQLVRFEEDTYSKKNTQAHSLTRQLKDATRELEAKNTHIDLLRKKLASIESESAVKAEKDWEEVIDDNRRLTRQLEKANRQLHEARQTNVVLKSDTADVRSVKAKLEEHRRHEREMQLRLQEVEATREKQAKRIAALKADKEQTEGELGKSHRATESTIHSLSTELQRTKQRTEEVHKREKQLSDLRVVIARMLGLDVGALAVPDYEIISRLERLIEGQNHLALNHTANPRLARATTNGSVGRSFVSATEQRARTNTGRATSSSRWK